MSASALFIAVFLATLVEAVEATTIVLAAGVARDWRSSLTGAVSAVLALAIAVAALGPAISAIPLRAVRIVVGAALLLFGLKWLRKAVLRASGYKALHDEAAIYQRTLEDAQDAAQQRWWLDTDRYAFGLSFQGVFLEGVEIVFIIVTVGGNAHRIPLAAIAAGCAVVVVSLAGVAVRAPMAKVPENTLKLIVGVMLTSFGLFWIVEGAGAHWPGDDAALLVIVPAIAAVALGAAAVLRYRRARSASDVAPLDSSNALIKPS